MAPSTSHDSVNKSTVIYITIIVFRLDCILVLYVDVSSFSVIMNILNRGVALLPWMIQFHLLSLCYWTFLDMNVMN